MDLLGKSDKLENLNNQVKQDQLENLDHKWQWNQLEKHGKMGPILEAASHEDGECTTQRDRSSGSIFCRNSQEREDNAEVLKKLKK